MSDKVTAILTLLSVGSIAVLWIGGVFVVIHFVIKYW